MKVLYSGSRDELNAKLQERDEAIERLSKDCERLAEALRWFIDDIDGTHTVMTDFDTNVERARTALQLHKGE